MDDISRQSEAVGGVDAARRRVPLAALLAVTYAFVAAPALWRGPLPTPGLALASLTLAAALVALSVIDIETYRLPDVLTLPLVAVGLGLAAVLGSETFAARGLAAVAGFAAFYAIDAIYRRLRGHAGLGLGDAKLLAAAGAWLGAEALPGVVLIGAVSALAAVGVVALRGAKIKLTTKLPFGPFLAFGFWIVWMYTGVE